MRASSLLLLIVLTGGCAHLHEQPRAAEDSVGVGRSVFLLSYTQADKASAQRIERALVLALPVAERWGSLSTPVRVRIHPGHRALEEVTGLRDLPWVRAWASYSTLDVQSPRTWSSRPSDVDLLTLITHELTHCVVYQATQNPNLGTGRVMPLWFREGMASVTAGEYHQSGYEAIWRFYRDQGSAGAADPLARPEKLLRSTSPLVYGTAHLAFQFLLEKQGEERVRKILLGMGEGLEFEEAFRDAVGRTVTEFEDEFRSYVEMRSWSRDDPSLRLEPPSPDGGG